MSPAASGVESEPLAGQGLKGLPRRLSQVGVLQQLDQHGVGVAVQAVQLLAEGPAGAVGRFLDAVRQYWGDSIEDEQVEERTPTGGHPGFSVPRERRDQMG